MSYRKELQMSLELQPCGTNAAYQRHMKAGEQPCEPCVLANREQSRASYKPKKLDTSDLQPCGTRAAYQRHVRAGEQPCDACLEANRERNRARYKPKPRDTSKLKPCGTQAAYKRHRAAGEEPCDACKKANRDAFRARREALRKKSPALKPCGTHAAYQRHLKAGEQPCEPCRQGYRDYMKEYLRKKAEKAKNAALPVVAPENAHKAPCTDPRNGYIWDPRADGEGPGVVEARWRRAAFLCVSECPVVAHCRESRALAGGDGVWAGRIPERVS
ncbi:hypothetical protein [Dietzia sp. ANT_WB102]|uniref:hypothetical protein n=1 Tax=Dietzia sp. ANT_WB102 TaxID=2597345 RepID=UPI0011EE4414|nr:hypothetical protein [Dietzia sp. ANT_WB102]KAA0916440.1 hypothetical protein FQ137_14545 [Dietzia sp. ANT_WB102]